MTQHYRGLSPFPPDLSGYGHIEDRRPWARAAEVSPDARYADVFAELAPVGPPPPAPHDDDRPTERIRSISELEAWALEGLELSRELRDRGETRRRRRIAAVLVVITAAPFALSGLDWPL